MANIPITFNAKVNQFEGTTYDKDGNLHRTDVAAGAAWWARDGNGNIAVLRFSCPCGCGTIGAVPLRPFNPNAWTWDGNEEKPSLTPSIQKLSGCRWHGYMTKGEWVRC